MRLIFVYVILSMTSSAYAWEIGKTEGDVTLAHAKGKPAKAVAAEVLKEGDTVTTGTAGKVLIKDGESEVWLAPKTTLQLHKLADSEKEESGRLDVIKGTMRAKFKRPSGPDEFAYQVKAKTVIAGVRGTAFVVAVEGKEEKICSFDGLVRVSSAPTSGESAGSSAEGWDVPSGKGVFIRPGEMPRVRETTEAQKKSWLSATTF